MAEHWQAEVNTELLETKSEFIALSRAFKYLSYIKQ